MLERIQRWWRRAPDERARLLHERLVSTFDPRLNALRLAHRVFARAVAPLDGPYRERPEVGPMNLETKLARVARGGPFEPYDVCLVNRAAAELTAGPPPPGRVLEVGSGTGRFVLELKALAPDTTILASELDARARAWANEHRAFPGVTYSAAALETLGADAFDLCVAIEVIEHVADFGGFLRELVRLAPRAVITTPNRWRSVDELLASPPSYHEHVREWTAGELHWVLRAFYREVRLFTLPDLPAQARRFARAPSYRPRVAPCGLNSAEATVIALCAR
ncbi:MAG: class I SAM-dependent methyltransferase [Planctomycetota bacterium]|nr:class I SAM-dependent methyltransferase [Planctomycetota bacterium]